MAIFSWAQKFGANDFMHEEARKQTLLIEQNGRVGSSDLKTVE
jgi:hypothetical protein